MPSFSPEPQLCSHFIFSAETPSPSVLQNSASLVTDLIKFPVTCSSISPDADPYHFTALLDGGAAAVDVISTALLDRLHIPLSAIDSSIRIPVCVANGVHLQTLGTISLTYSIGKHSFTDYFNVLPSTLSTCILSLTWQTRYGLVFHARTREVWIESSNKQQLVRLPTCEMIPLNSLTAPHSFAQVTFLSLTDVFASQHQDTDEDDWFLCVLHVDSSSTPTSANSSSSARSSDMSPEEQAISLLLDEFSDVITDDLPANYNISREFQATIDILPDAKPVSLRPYRLPLFLEQELQTTLEYLLSRNIIEPSNCPFGFPVLYSRRQNDPRSPTDPSSYRLCTDLRKLNAMVNSNPRYPTPNPEEMLESVAEVIRKSKRFLHPSDYKLWISALDLLRGFWQIPVAPDHRKYVAIITKFGKYQFRNLPFGYIHASNIFQEWITLLFRDITSVFPYIDDLLILDFGTFE